MPGVRKDEDVVDADAAHEEERDGVHHAELLLPGDAAEAEIPATVVFTALVLLHVTPQAALSMKNWVQTALRMIPM